MYFVCSGLSQCSTIVFRQWSGYCAHCACTEMVRATSAASGGCVEETGKRREESLAEVREEGEQWRGGMTLRAL